MSNFALSQSNMFIWRLTFYHNAHVRDASLQGLLLCIPEIVA